jgi:creatinine amidohydrolase
MLLQLCTWQEVEARLKDSAGIIVPIGSTEQHGPNGLIGTDAICAEAIAKAIGQATDALVAPTLAIGMAQHHMAFAGSMTLRPSTLIAVVRDCVQSLARHGFRRFFFVNGHGGNIASVTAAFSEIYAEASLGVQGNAPTVRCRLKNWWMTESCKRLSQELFPGVEGSHATPSEVSVTQYLHPDAIKRAELAPALAPNGEFADAADYRRRFPDGRIGSNPGLASPQAGERILKAVVAEIADEYRAFAGAA